MTAIPSATAVAGISTLNLLGQAAAETGVPAWANLASTTGLGMALGWFVYQLSRGKLVSNDTQKHLDNLNEVVERTQNQNAALTELVEKSGEREDRLMSYLEGQRGPAS